ncbi:MAG: MFS transporter [Negativicutes bacterium]|nr:MFS transporter [Negativicutes bacterium]
MDQAVRSKTFRWTVVLPIVMVEYILAYVDRTNISFALDGMQKTFAMTSATAGFVSGLFFIGYVLLQLPAGHLASRISATRNILVLSILWGLFSALQGAVTSATELSIVRFLLGVVEGGMFPSIYVVIANWFPENERGRASSFFTFYITVAPLVMSPISGWIVSSVDWLGLPGWRWLFFLEGAPGIIWGIIFWLMIPDNPHKASAKQLGDAERSFLLAEFEKEAAKPRVVQEKSYAKAALNPSFIFLTLSFTGLVMGNYGIGIWLPVIIKGISNFGYTTVGFIAAVPWLFATIAMVVAGVVNDRWGNKRMLIILVELVAAVAFLGVTWTGTNNLWLSVFFISIAAAGIAAVQGVYFSMLPELITKDMVGGLTGIFAAVANIGGFVGPFVVGALMAGGDKLGGMIFLSGMLFVAAFFIAFCKVKTGSEASG